MIYNGSFRVGATFFLIKKNCVNLPLDGNGPLRLENSLCSREVILTYM